MKNNWRYIYWVIGLLLISSIIIGWERTIPYNPLALKTIVTDIESALAFSLLGISMVFNYEAMLKWIENHFRLSLPTGRFRLLGCFFSCISLFMLILSVNNFLVYLGIVPNPYVP